MLRSSLIYSLPIYPTALLSLLRLRSSPNVSMFFRELIDENKVLEELLRRSLLVIHRFYRI